MFYIAYRRMKIKISIKFILFIDKTAQMDYYYIIVNVKVNGRSKNKNLGLIKCCTG